MDLLWGTIGGLVIGSAAAFFLLMNGRIMGASGILGGLVDGTAKASTRTENAVFLLGLIIAPALANAVSGREGNTQLVAPFGLVVAAGLLVGFGTRIGNGCTSGHGVCGISRLSIRGIAATVFYIAAGATTVAAVRLLLGGQ